MLTLAEFMTILISAGLTGAIALAFLSRSDRVAPQVPDDPLALLFHDGVLHHGSLRALHRFALMPGTHVWDDLRTVLLSRFPTLPSNPGTGDAGQLSITADGEDDLAILRLSWRAGICWVEITEETSAVAHFTDDTFTTLDHCARTLSHPAWEVDKKGSLIWANPAYRTLEQSHHLGSLDLTHPEAGHTIRKAITDVEGRNDWFDITGHPTNRGTLFHATRQTPLMHAEEAQRRFVQTLAKTFAHLSIGLAIFDRAGQLSIFNPALVDLTGLKATFLATRPDMLSFFDALRENRQMPEPKNYRTWRQDIAEMIAAASGGKYRETWTLEDGRTYTVQGRPHPDGATAFLIEDISAEITLARSYRAEVEQFETLLDSVDDALVVFSSSGVLTLCNAAYRNLWGQNPDAAFADVTFSDAVTLWSEKSSARGGWQTVANLAALRGIGTSHTLDLQMQDGTTLACRIAPMGTESVLVRFSTRSDVLDPPKRTQITR